MSLSQAKQSHCSLIQVRVASHKVQVEGPLTFILTLSTARASRFCQTRFGIHCTHLSLTAVRLILPSLPSTARPCEVSSGKICRGGAGWEREGVQLRRGQRERLAFQADLKQLTVQSSSFPVAPLACSREGYVYWPDLQSED